MNLTLRAKFLILSAVVQALVVGVLIYNSLRIMDNAVDRNADRVAHEYAVTLNLSLGPYASQGRLTDLHSYLEEMLADQGDSFVRYIVVLDKDEKPLVTAGAVPANMHALLHSAGARTRQGLTTVRHGDMLYARAPLLLQNTEVGSLNFGLSTADLASARDEVLQQGSLISLAGFGIGLLLLYAFTRGLGQRLAGLTAQSQRLASGDYGSLLAEHGGDEIEIVSRSMNTMSLALRARIAQLEQAEQRISEADARFKTLFDVAPVPLAVSDPHGVLIAGNLAMRRTFSISTDGMVGKNWSELADWHQDDKRQLLRAFQHGGTLQGEVVRVTMPNGGAGSIAFWSSALALGGERALIWALMDLTAELDAKHALEELNLSLETRVQQRSAELEQANDELNHTLKTLQRTQHDLLAAEKMAALGSLVAGIAHELNTPIGNSLLASTALTERVAGFGQQVRAGALKRSDVERHLEELGLASDLVASSLHRAANLISSFKQVAVDQTSDQRREFDLLAALQDTLATYGPMLQRANCEAVLDVPNGLLFDSYPGSLYQVINNLINNALVHAFEPGKDARISLIASDNGEGQVALQFTDNGRGMQEDVLRHVFDPFFTTRMGQGGSGLGMNIVYNIVTGVLGGQIEVKAEPGAGTTIRIVVPRVAPRREMMKKSLPPA